MKRIRIQKVLSEYGIASRRKAEEMIKSDLVKVNGEIAKIGDKIDLSRDKIFVAGRPLELNIKKYYLMLYKPRGFISTMSDEFGRKCVASLVKDIPTRVYPVGRLDKDSEGLLLMTNDGDFSNKILHPSKEIEKKYRVTVKPKITEDKLTKLSSITKIDDYKIEPAKINVLKAAEDRTVLEIIIKEGKNRQIRKMCEQADLEVARLKRTAIGDLKLGMLQPGKWRELFPQEIKKLLKK